MSWIWQILSNFLYVRVGGVSREGCAYPSIQITGRLCHFLPKLTNFSFHRLLFFLFHYLNFSIKFHIHTLFWMETSPIDYWHFQTLWVFYGALIWMKIIFLIKPEVKVQFFINTVENYSKMKMLNKSLSRIWYKMLM